MIQTILFALLAQLCLAGLGFAAPIEAETKGTAWQYGTGGGIVGVVILIVDIILFVEIIKSNRPPLYKLLWCLLIFFFPVLGAIIYLLFSDRAAHNSSSGYETLP